MTLPTVRMMTLVLALAGGEALAMAGEPITLTIGQRVAYSPGFAPAFVSCADPAIVRVGLGTGAFELEGLAPGRTQCVFTHQIAKLGRRDVVDVTVVR